MISSASLLSMLTTHVRASATLAGGTFAVACGFTLYSGHLPLSLIQGHSFLFSD